MKTYLPAGVLSLLFCALVESACATTALSIGESQTNVSCPGGSNGAVTITPKGGTAPYTFLWNDGDTTQNRANLTANTYNITVKDSTGKTAFLSITITQPSPFIIARAITNEKCGGDKTGTISLTVNGGTPGYTYLWSNGATTSALSGLYAAEYYVTITDGNGCQTIDSCNVTQPVGIAIAAANTPATCGASNGSSNVTVQYGNPGYTYQWSNDSTSADITGLAGGTYNLTVTDVLGCTATASEVINQQAGTLTINYSITPPACGGGNNGSINITSVIGSTGPFSYSWNTSATTQSISNVGAGSYSVTVTSGTECTATTTITVVAAANLNITLHPVALTCFGAGDGAVTTNVSGGVSPYTYNWGNGETTKDLTAGAAGTYILTVTDNRGCFDTASVTITQPALMSTTATPSPPTCAGGLTGSITTSTSGGTPSYSYWWGLGVNTQNRNNLGAGTYDITVTDAQGCTSTASATIVDYVPMDLSATPVNVTCFGAKTGSVSLTISNGWTPYAYSWYNGETVQNISSLAAGTYTVTVTDSHGCSVTTSAVVSQPAFAITINSTVTNIVCNGANTGSITLTVADGVSPYSFDWSNSDKTSGISALSIGKYTVTVTDNAGCTATDAFVISQPGPIVITATDTNVTCFGGSNGSIHLSVSGGLAPFIYNWSNGSKKQNLTNAAAGDYTVTVTDSHACTESISTDISQPANAVVSATIQNVSCFGNNNGSISVSVTGGTSPYTYKWPGGNTTTLESNLTAATYILTVTDQAGCTYADTTTVTQPAGLSATASATNILCNGANSGAINLTVSGGTLPYNFNWGAGITTQNRTNLAAGNYTVTITDMMNCTTTDSAVIIQASAINAIATVKNATCNGAGNGSINLSVSGGTPTYSYNWSNGMTSASITNLGPGSFIVTITDHAACNSMDTLNITQPAPINIADTTTNISCFGGNNGSITTGVTGGSTPYQLQWNDGVTTPGRTSLIAGVYQLTVTDRQSCTASISVTLSQPAQLNISDTVNNISCNGGNNGSIVLYNSGGVSPHTYNWGGGITSVSRNNLAAGSYPVTLTDANNCSASVTISVTQPNPLLLNAAKTDMLCYAQPNGAINLQVTGGTPAYQYNWGNNIHTQNRTALDTGTYVVTVTDANACTATTSASISEPAEITASTTSITNASCFGSTNGGISISVTGGTPNYSFSWSNSTTNQNLSNVSAGNYTVSITDSNNCTAASTISITQPPAITIAARQVSVSCYGGANGALVTPANGGNQGFNYAWSNNASGDSITGLSAGVYMLTVTDAMNCSASFAQSVSQPAQLLLAYTDTNVSCNGLANGNINLGASGGTMPYSYTWQNGSTTQSLANLSAGSYSATVSDSNSCVASVSIIVSEPPILSVTFSQTNFGCPSHPGSIALAPAGGTPPYSCLWSNGDKGQTVGNLAVGNYTVTITDIQACTITTGTTITNVPQLQINLAPVNASCFADTNGSVNLSTTGGTPPFTYLWTNNATTQNLINLDAGTYTVSVTDSNNCSSTATTTISQPSQIQIAKSVNDPACPGSSNGAIQITVSGGTPTYAYHWNNNDTTENLTGVVTGTYAVTVVDAQNCQAVMNNIVVNQPTAIEVQTIVTPGTCTTNEEGDVKIIVTGGTAPYLANWSNNTGIENLTSVSAGTYTVTVTDSKQCTATATATVTAGSGIEVTSTVNSASCTGVLNGAINLTVSGGTPEYKYSWNNGASERDLSNIAPGSYAVTVSDATGCSTQSEFTVGADYTLQVNITGQNTVTNGQPVQLTATASVDNNNIYSWSPAADVSCGSCNITEANPGQTTLLAVSVTDMNGCHAMDTITIYVNTNTSIYIPNAFSPNKDGNNDVFHIYGNLASIRFMDLVVFDRLGEKVFETNDYNNGWDGEFRGEPAPVGTYVYVASIAFADGSEKDLKGSVNLFR